MKATPPGYWPTRQLLRILNKFHILSVEDYTTAMRIRFPTQ